MRYTAALLLFLAMALPANAKNALQHNTPAPSSYTEERNDQLVGHSKEEEIYATSNFDDDNATILGTQNQTVQEKQPATANSSAASYNANATTFAPNSTNGSYSPSQRSPKNDTFNADSAPYKTSLRLFQLIPPTIFDNTTEGLSEEDKEQLSDTGKTSFWDITSLSDSELIISSRSEYSDTEVTLKLFNADNGDTIVALGVNSGDSCALELWKSDSKNRITPVAMPPEPPIKDFLGPKKNLPPATEVSMQFCLDPLAEGLAAYPLIWSSYGLNQIKLTNEVNYKWNGKEFVKEIIPIAQ